MYVYICIYSRHVLKNHAALEARKSSSTTYTIVSFSKSIKPF